MSNYYMDNVEDIVKHIYELIHQYKRSREHARECDNLDYIISYQGSVLSLYRLLADITGESVMDLMKENED